MKLDQVKKVKIGLIFTLDYEIHGNGSGEFENWAYLPTAQMLNVFDTYGAKLTIMAEMGNYWAMQNHRELFQKDIDLFESQLKEAIERGHDVQLHFHPQWIDAKYEHGEWVMDFSRNTIERLCHNYNDAYSFLKKGKDDLQNLLKPVNQLYQCVGFRAGFLQMQPSGNMIKALTETGFLSDSSVSKGMRANDNLRLLDYTTAYSAYKPWKPAESEICNSDPEGRLYEFPILSGSVKVSRKIIDKLNKIKGAINIRDLISYFMSRYGKGMPSDTKEHLSVKIKRILKTDWGYADFCLKEPSYLIKHIKMAISDSKRNNDGFVPIVLIGHSKDFFFANNLSLFLESCKNIEEVEFITYADAIKRIMAENKEKSN